MDSFDNTLKLFELPTQLPIDLSQSLYNDINDRKDTLKDTLKRDSNVGVVESKEQLEEILKVARPTGMDKSASKATATTAVINRTII